VTRGEGTLTTGTSTGAAVTLNVTSQYTPMTVAANAASARLI